MDKIHYLSGRLINGIPTPFPACNKDDIPDKFINLDWIKSNVTCDKCLEYIERSNIVYGGNGITISNTLVDRLRR